MHQTSLCSLNLEPASPFDKDGSLKLKPVSVSFYQPCVSTQSCLRRLRFCLVGRCFSLLFKAAINFTSVSFGSFSVGNTMALLMRKLELSRLSSSAKSCRAGPISHCGNLVAFACCHAFCSSSPVFGVADKTALRAFRA